MIINKALLKYGYSEFKLEILENCEPNNVIKREQSPLLKPEYNILQIAGSSLGYKHTEETIAKLKSRLSYKRTSEIIEKIRKANIGLKRSEETKAKIRSVRLGKKHTEETKLKVAKARGTLVKVTDKETGKLLNIILKGKQLKSLTLL
jgi:group I intron endonuclease